MKVLVTGGAGYLGSRLLPRLLSRGHDVRVLDLLPPGPHLAALVEEGRLTWRQGDMRNPTALAPAVEGAQAAVHLAALVLVTGRETDAEAREIEDVNHLATRQVVDASRAAGVRRFIFTSTVSSYSLSDPAHLATEEDALHPSSPYAVAKVRAEEYLMAASTPDFRPTVLRLATLFGGSPRLQLTSLFNQLVKDAVETGSLTVYDGAAWRVFVHVDDAASAIEMVLAAPEELVAGEVFNVGASHLNARKGDLAQVIQEALPSTRVELVASGSIDRSYRVSFDKVSRVLGFTTTKELRDGVREVVAALAGEQPFHAETAASR